MKKSVLPFLLIYLFCVSTHAIETNVSRSDSLPPMVTWNGITGDMQTNLMAWGGHSGTIVTEGMLKTNALAVYLKLSQKEADDSTNRFVSAPFCRLYIYNYTTNIIDCLRLPREMTWTLSLADKNGNQVPRTRNGKKFSNQLFEDQVSEWYRNWNNRRLSMYVMIFPDNSFPTDFGGFWLKDLFEIKGDGEYELRVQVRIVQAATDPSGKMHFIKSVIPKAVAKFQISSGAIPK